MSAIFGSCCGGRPDTLGDSGEEVDAPMRTAPGSSNTAADNEARSRAAEAAEARQLKFDQSAVGRATKKSVANVKKEREADAQRQQDRTRDWLN